MPEEERGGVDRRSSSRTYGREGGGGGAVGKVCVDGGVFSE